MYLSDQRSTKSQVQLCWQTIFKPACTLSASSKHNSLVEMIIVVTFSVFSSFIHYVLLGLFHYWPGQTMINVLLCSNISAIMCLIGAEPVSESSHKHPQTHSSKGHRKSWLISSCFMHLMARCIRLPLSWPLGVAK